MNKHMAFLYGCKNVGGFVIVQLKKKEWARRSSNRAYCLSWKWVSRSVAIKNFICSQQIADFLYCNVQYMYIVYRPETYHKMNLIKSCFFSFLLRHSWLLYFWKIFFSNHFSKTYLSRICSDVVLLFCLDWLMLWVFASKWYVHIYVFPLRNNITIGSWFSL